MSTFLIESVDEWQERQDRAARHHQHLVAKSLTARNIKPPVDPVVEAGREQLYTLAEYNEHLQLEPAVLSVFNKYCQQGRSRGKASYYIPVYKSAKDEPLRSQPHRYSRAAIDRMYEDFVEYRTKGAQRGRKAKGTDKNG